MNIPREEKAVFGTSSLYNFKYNGKELQETGFYDYGWRSYMSDIGRWFGMDQLSEVYSSFSPYSYVGNNPVMRTDPDGRKWAGNDIQMLEAEHRAWRNSGGGGGFASYFASGGSGFAAEMNAYFGNTGSGWGTNFGGYAAFGQTQMYKDIMAYLTQPEYFQGIDFSQFTEVNSNPFVFMIGGADLALGLMGKSETTLSIENTLKRNGMNVSSYNHDYFGSNSDVTQGFANYIAAQYSILKTDVILYGYSRGGVEVMKVARLLEKQNIPIKLMITVDAANGPYSDQVNRVIPRNVQNVINYYQTDASSNKLRSIGGPAVRATGSNTNIQNYNVTGSYFFLGGSRNSSQVNHSNIDEAYRNEVLYNILKYRR
jgi:RHS repeat-associated protein